MDEIPFQLEEIPFQLEEIPFQLEEIEIHLEEIEIHLEEIEFQLEEFEIQLEEIGLERYRIGGFAVFFIVEIGCFSSLSFINLKRKEQRFFITGLADCKTSLITKFSPDFEELFFTYQLLAKIQDNVLKVSCS